MNNCNCIFNQYGKVCSLNKLFFDMFNVCPKNEQTSDLKIGDKVKDSVGRIIGFIHEIHKSKYGYNLYDVVSVGVLHKSYLRWRLTKC